MIFIKNVHNFFIQFNDICQDGIGGETFATVPPTVVTTTQKTRKVVKLHLNKQLQAFNCASTTENACSMAVDIAIMLDAYDKLKPISYHPWQKYFAKRLISEFDMEGNNTARITVNPISHQKQSMTRDFYEEQSSSKVDLCHFVHGLKPRDRTYRGGHFFEGLYPVMAPIYFSETGPERKRVMVIVKHLTDDTELDYTEYDRSASYWSGDLEEPEVFVVAVGQQTQYTAQIDRLLRVAGSPSRLLFVTTWTFEEMDAIVPLIRKRICELPNMPATTRAPITPPRPDALCMDEDHTSWEAPVCCAQLDLFVGLQISDTPNMTNSLTNQINVLKKLLDGFIINADYLMVSIGLLNNRTDLVHTYTNQIGFSNKQELHEALNDLIENGVDHNPGADMIDLSQLELLNRNEFFAKRYLTRSNAKKLSIIFRGDDTVISHASDFDYEARGIRPDFEEKRGRSGFDSKEELKADFEPLIIPGLEGHPIYGITYANYGDEDFANLAKNGTKGDLLEVENFEALDRYVNVMRKNLCKLAEVPVLTLPPKPPQYPPKLHIVTLIKPGAFETSEMTNVATLLKFMLEEISFEVEESEWGQEVINHPELTENSIQTIVHLYGAGLSLTNVDNNFLSIDLDAAINRAVLGAKTPDYSSFLHQMKNVMMGLNGPEGQIKPSKLLILTFGSNGDYNNIINAKNPLYHEGKFFDVEQKLTCF